MASKETVLIAVFIFLLLFRPTIVPIDLIYPLTAFSTIMLLFRARRSRPDIKAWLRSLLASRYFILSILVCLISLVGFLYNWYLTGSSIDSVIAPYFMGVVRFGVTFLLFPVNLAWIFAYSKSKRLTADDLLRAVFFAITAQLIFVIAAYLFPPVKDAIIWLMQENGNWTDRWTQNGTAEYRMFGFAKSLFDTFGFGLGVLSAVPWIISYRLKDLRYLLILPLMFFAVFINARTGLVIMGVATLVFMTFYALKWRHFLNKSGEISVLNRRILLGVCAMIIVASVGVASFIQRGGYLSTIIWRDIGGYVRFITSGGDINETRGTQAYKNLSGEWWTMPERPLQLLIGAGQSVYGQDSVQDFSSDVGYVNNIWLLGLVGTVMLHLLMFYAMWKFAPNDGTGKALAVLGIISVLMFQVKGSALWSANLGVSSIILIYAIAYYENRLHKRKLAR